MTVLENHIGATVFWERLPINLALAVVAFLALFAFVGGPLIPGLGTVEGYLAIAMLFFLLIQLGLNPLMIGLNRQSYGRGPLMVELHPDRVTCWIPPPHTQNFQRDGIPVVVDLPYDHLESVSVLGIPGAVVPFARFRSQGLVVPDGLFFNPQSEYRNLMLTRGNAIRLLEAWTAWKGGRPLP